MRGRLLAFASGMVVPVHDVMVGVSVTRVVSLLPFSRVSGLCYACILITRVFLVASRQFFFCMIIPNRRLHHRHHHHYTVTVGTTQTCKAKQIGSVVGTTHDEINRNQ